MISWERDQWEPLFPKQMSYQEKVLRDTALLSAARILRCAFLATQQLPPDAEYQKLRAGPNSDSPSYSLSEPTAGEWWLGISRPFRRISQHLSLQGIGLIWRVFCSQCSPCLCGESSCGQEFTTETRRH